MSVYVSDESCLDRFADELMDLGVGVGGEVDGLSLSSVIIGPPDTSGRQLLYFCIVTLTGGDIKKVGDLEKRHPVDPKKVYFKGFPDNMKPGYAYIAGMSVVYWG